MKPLQIQHIHKPKEKRRLPNDHAKGEILESQKHCCFYCGNAFGTVFVKRFINVVRRPVWDHISPYSVTHNNSFLNFAASCQECNGIKRDTVFDTFIEAARCIRVRREKKGYVNMPVWGNTEIRRKHKQDMIADATFGIVFGAFDLSGLTQEELRAQAAKLRFLYKAFQPLPPTTLEETPAGAPPANTTTNNTTTN